MKHRKKLFLTKRIYELPQTDQVFVKAMKENIAFHRQHCPEYQEILDSLAYDPHSISGIEGEALFIQAQVTLNRYHRQIEGRNSSDRIYRGKNCSITACSDQLLESSDMYRNIWVKALPREDLLQLRPYKNYLQTAALLCGEEEYDKLAHSLLRAGLVKISDGFEMSNYALGEAHDGMFTLRCYTKLVSVQSN